MSERRVSVPFAEKTERHGERRREFRRATSGSGATGSPSLPNVKFWPWRPSRYLPLAGGPDRGAAEGGGGRTCWREPGRRPRCPPCARAPRRSPLARRECGGPGRCRRGSSGGRRLRPLPASSWRGRGGPAPRKAAGGRSRHDWGAPVWPSSPRGGGRHRRRARLRAREGDCSRGRVRRAGGPRGRAVARRRSRRHGARVRRCVPALRSGGGGRPWPRAETQGRARVAPNARPRGGSGGPGRTHRGAGRARGAGGGGGRLWSSGCSRGPSGRRPGGGTPSTC